MDSTKITANTFIIITVIILALLVALIGYFAFTQEKTEISFCKGKEGIQVMYIDAYKKYLNCTELKTRTPLEYAIP